MPPSGYLLVYEKIRIQLDCGKLLPGDALRSEKELAELHDVSRTTLRKALSRLETEGRIVRRPGIGNFVCQNESSTEPQGPLNIGIEIADGFHQSPFLMQILQHSQNAAAELHANLLLKTAEELCAAQGLDAAIFTLIPDNNYQRVAELARRIPVAMINRITELPGLSYVAVDYEDTVRRVISRLLHNGARRILFIGGSPTPAYYAPYTRERGYRRAFAENQLIPEEESIVPHAQVPDFRKMGRLLKAKQPEILFIASESGIPPTITALESVRHDLKQPVHLICFDNVSDYDCYSKIPLSGIAMPFRAMAYRTVNHLVDCCRHGAQSPVREIYQASVVVRECPFLI